MMKFNFILPVLFISQISAAAIVTKLTCEATQPRASVKSVNLLMDTAKKYPNNLSLEMEVFTGDKLSRPIVRIESTPDGTKYFIPKNNSATMVTHHYSKLENNTLWFLSQAKLLFHKELARPWFS